MAATQLSASKDCDGRRAGAGVRTDAIREEFGVLLTAHTVTQLGDCRLGAC